MAFHVDKPQATIQRWFAALEQRKSRRRYTSKNIESKTLNQMQEACENFQPFQEARGVLIRKSDPAIFQWIAGRYGLITGAPSFLAFVGQSNGDRVQEKVGYTGQGLILEATALGLSTCWVGGTFQRQKALDLIPLREGEELVAVSALGYVGEEKTFKEKAISIMARSHRRLPLTTIGHDFSNWPRWAQKGLEAVQFAPSAVNRQPWRFQYKDSEVIISPTPGPNPFKRLDCGIAMLHFELGVRQATEKGRWEFTLEPDIGRFIQTT